MKALLMTTWLRRLAAAGLSAGMLAGARAADYLVIDLSAGPVTARYPVSELNAPPEGGWTGEYKTTRIVLRRIPAGTFPMGSISFRESGPAGKAKEAPRQVTLTQDFYIGVFEVTQRQWERVMGDWPSSFCHEACRDMRPVERVSYRRVRGGSGGGRNAPPVDPQSSFTGRLRLRTGRHVDLPTEAQWEYACRAGTATDLNSGKNLTSAESCPNLGEIGRYAYNGGADEGPEDSPSTGTAVVGSYPPNAWGLYDMHGNVWEWCIDYFGAYNARSQTDPVAATQGGGQRVARGGSWGNAAIYCRSASRYSNRDDYSSNSFGFRIAVLPAGPVVEPQKPPKAQEPKKHKKQKKGADVP